MKSSPLNVWVVDKTVPNADYREHKGVMWVLNSRKIVDEKTGEPYREDEDYYGFFPDTKDNYSTKELPDTVENPDLIYLADTYGVYKDDYLSNKPEGTRSDPIYGGLNDSEIESIKANLGGGNTIIGEFNTASAPTNMENRNQMSEIFRVSWIGWSGRYFRDLTKGAEVPTWTVLNFEKQNNAAWDFTGEGFVLVSDEDKVVVLQKGKEIGDDDICISFDNKYIDEFGVDGKIRYDYWFEFIKPSSSVEVLANYTLDLTDQGKAVLDELELPHEFPAIVRSSNTQYSSYYFAGDFADRDFEGFWSSYYGFSKIKSIFTVGTKGDNTEFFWKCYVPIMEKIIEDIKSSEKNIPKEYVPNDEIQYASRTSGTGFQILRDGEWADFFVKGVNIGSSTPGKWFTEFSNDEDMYIRWFEQIAGMNANSIRIYTLLSPQFYSALEYYNKSHPDSVLWLYQEIWPEENPYGDDYLQKDYDEAYASEIRNVIDAMHGQANIKKRQGRAYGIYTGDVSQYIAGYLVGRELEPEEVLSTNEKNEGYMYSGEYLFCSEDASPTEAWLAMSCDYALKYEAERYGWQHPVGIVSWPTLDPKEHDSEWNISGDKMLEYNDKVSVDINHILARGLLKTGFFGAYHIYPNYPDFMNNEESYADYTDNEGSFRYGGYLREFIEGHTKYPALVAEFGISTGMGNAHGNPDGYNHGGLTEIQQGEGIVRMMKAIKNEGYAGGIIFEWTDEWAKKTWITEPYIIPFDRNPLWHNAVDPEQNYGIVAMESEGSMSEPYSVAGDGVIEKIQLSADETFLNIKINLQREIDFADEKLIIGLDTYDRYRGNFKYSDEIQRLAPSGLEYIIEINSQEDANLLVHPGYNASMSKYSSYRAFNGIFEKMSLLINKDRITADGRRIKAVYFDESKLNYGVLENNSHNNWTIEGNRLEVRIPWGRINFTDPSNMKVLDDTSTVISPGTDELKTTVSDGIIISALLLDVGTNEAVDVLGSLSNNAFKWDNWDIPNYRERFKDSYMIIRASWGIHNLW